MTLRAFAAGVLPLSILGSLGAFAVTTTALESTARAQGAAPPAAPSGAQTGTSTAPSTPSKDASKPGETTGVIPPKSSPEGTQDAKPAADPELVETDGNRAVYLSADIGFGRADVGAFSDNTGFDKTGANGVIGGLGIGYRFKGMRLGARFRSTSTTEYTLWSIMAEAGYGLGLRPLDVVFLVHAGYVFDVGIDRPVIASSLPPGNRLTPDIDLSGAVIGFEAHATYYVSRILRVGPFLGFDATFLSRAQARPPQSIAPLEDSTLNNPLYGDSGSGVGYIVNLGLRGTVDLTF